MKQMHINYFCRVARAKSLTVVARELGVSQPAVSYAIKEFEDELGLKLFTREKKKINLTPDGKKIYSFLGPALEQMDIAVKKAQNYAKSKSVLRLAIPETFGSLTVTKHLNAFKSLFPDFKVLVKELEFNDARDMIFSGDIDIAVQVYPVEFNDEDLVFLKASETPLYFVVGRNHPLAAFNSLRFEEIANTPIVLPSENSLIYQSVVAEFERQGLTPNIILSSPQQSTIVELVEYGNSATFLCHDPLIAKNPKIKLIPIKPEIRFAVGLFYAKSTQLSSSSKAVADHIYNVMVKEMPLK
ncbi:MAG: LysR family transcriptional regulator [Bacilli bacterium]|nr:LysR family transcriptional regulator [Bacilli bacterium]